MNEIKHLLEEIERRLVALDLLCYENKIDIRPHYDYAYFEVQEIKKTINNIPKSRNR